jgi:hypothetical protein
MPSVSTFVFLNWLCQSSIKGHKIPVVAYSQRYPEQPPQEQQLTVDGGLPHTAGGLFVWKSVRLAFVSFVVFFLSVDPAIDDAFLF